MIVGSSKKIYDSTDGSFVAYVATSTKIDCSLFCLFMKQILRNVVLLEVVPNKMLILELKNL